MNNFIFEIQQGAVNMYKSFHAKTLPIEGINNVFEFLCPQTMMLTLTFRILLLTATISHIDGLSDCVADVAIQLTTLFTHPSTIIVDSLVMCITSLAVYLFNMTADESVNPLAILLCRFETVGRLRALRNALDGL